MTDDTDFPGDIRISIARISSPARPARRRPARCQGSRGPSRAPLLSDPSLPVNVTLRVNGEANRSKSTHGPPCSTRCASNIGLTGAKKGCDHGQWRRLHSTDRRPAGGILSHAGARCEGASRSSRIEGLAKGGALASDAGEAFVDQERLPVRLLHAGSNHVGRGLA